MFSLRPFSRILSRSTMLVAASALVSICLANQPPVVNAGDDQEVRINNANVFLFGDASDDSSADNLILLWKQVSGPSSSSIVDPASSLTRISFPALGTYKIELSANDGALIGRDTTKITVLDSLPFTILAPRNNAQIVIGKPFVVRWQLEPMRMCEVAYSLNDGLSFGRIALLGSVRDSTTWLVDPSYKDSARQGIMLVHEYQNEPFRTTSTFVLVDSLSSADPFFHERPSSQPRVTIDRMGTIRVEGLSAALPPHIRILGANGRLLFDANASQGSVDITRFPDAVVLYHLDCGLGRTYSGRLLCGTDATGPGR